MKTISLFSAHLSWTYQFNILSFCASMLLSGILKKISQLHGAFMAMDLLKELHKNVFNMRYSKHILTVCVLLLAVLGGVYAYDAYRATREARAHRIFVESYALYEQILNQEAKETSPEKKKGMWEEVEMAFGAGYQQCKYSRLAPYFQGFQAEALIHQEKFPQALEIINEMLLALPARSPFYAPYGVKRALLKLDMDDTKINQEGLTELTELSSDQRNLERDEALYHLGLYYWMNADQQKARAIWQQVIDLGKQGKNPVVSPWEDLIRSKISFE